MLWYLSCEVGKAECDGAYLMLDDLDAGKPLGFFGFGLIKGAILVSLKGSRAVIEWGMYRLFTVDVAEKRVTYVESGKNVEGRGESSCKGLLE